MLEEFFAVTRTSVYHVKAESEDGAPSATKIALRGNSVVLVGQKLWRSDGMILVGKRLIGYIPEEHGATSPLVGVERDFNRVSSRWWGEGTSSVIALFAKENEAMQCFNESDLEPCDPRWVEQTRQVLNAIGDDHPAFFVPHDDLALFTS